MTAIPGTPQTQNLIPMKYYGTTPMAAPIMGITAALFMFVLGMLWLTMREKKFTAKGNVFVEPEKKNNEEAVVKDLPNALLSFLPLLSVILTLNLFGWDIVISLISGIL